MKDDRLYLNHIIECIGNIKRYLAGDENIFFDDDKTRDAVMRQLQIMSESTQRLSDECKTKMPEIEWHKISAFRNAIVHDYLGDIDINLVFESISKRLPELKTAIARVLKESEQ